MLGFVTADFSFPASESQKGFDPHPGSAGMRSRASMVAQRLGLGQYLKLARGGGRRRPGRSILADAVEAVFAAVCIWYGGIEAASP